MEENKSLCFDRMGNFSTSQQQFAAQKTILLTHVGSESKTGNFVVLLSKHTQNFFCSPSPKVIKRIMHEILINTKISRHILFIFDKKKVSVQLTSMLNQPATLFACENKYQWKIDRVMNIYDFANDDFEYDISNDTSEYKQESNFE